MKSIISFLLLLFAVNSFAHDSTNWLFDKKAFDFTQNSKPRKFKKNKNLVNLLSFNAVDIDMEFFKHKLQQFSGAKHVTLDGTFSVISERESLRGRSLARKFLLREYQTLGYRVYEAPYRSGKNIIAEKKGTTDRVLIISAHFDSIGNAGANDNGSGVIGALTIAKAISYLNLKHTVRFISFDEEEKGMLGSKGYVAQLSEIERKKIIGVLNFEMMGTNSRKDGKFHIIDCERPKSSALTTNMLQVIDAFNINLEHVPGCTERSDHSSFWKRNIPAIVISENFFGGDSDLCYHKACDKYDARLDFNYIENIIKTVALTSLNLIQKID